MKWIERLQGTWVPESYDAEQDTLDVVINSGSVMMRRGIDGPYTLQLGTEPENVDLARANAGAPVLDSHNEWGGLNSVLGAIVPGTAKAADGRVTATVRLSDAPGDRDRTDKIRTGIVRNWSPGILIHASEVTEATEEQVRHVLATRWELYELSAVAVPADPQAQSLAATRPSDQAASRRPAKLEEKEIETMPTEEIRAAAEKAALQERRRAKEIRTLGRRFDLGDLAEQLVEDGTPADAAKARLLEALAHQDDETRIDSTTRVEQLTCEHAKRGETIRDALIARAEGREVDLQGDARQWLGMSMLEIGRRDLESRGHSVKGYGPRRLATAILTPRARHDEALAAHMTTDDLPSVFANVAHQSLRKGYASRERTFTRWCNRGQLSDFRPATRVQTSDVPVPVAKTQDGEFQRVTISDTGEAIQLATAGLIIGFTREALINDAIGALGRVPSQFGGSCAEYENATVYAHLIANPVMADGNQYFDAANHANVVAAPGAPSAAQLSATRLLLAVQTAPQAGKLRLALKYIVAPEAQRTVWEQLLVTTRLPGTPAATDVTPSMRQVELVFDPILDDDSIVHYYGFADPAVIDTFEYAYLAGDQGPYTETRLGWEYDGIEMKCRLDFAVKAIEWRSGVYNAGA